MKLTVLAFALPLLAGCGRPSPESAPRDLGRAEQTDAAASAYAFARRCVVESLGTMSGDTAGGWTIPKSSIEAEISVDNSDRSLYHVVLAGSRPSVPPRTWIVTLRRVGEAWEKVKIETPPPI